MVLADRHGAVATLVAFLTSLGVIISRSRGVVGQLRDVARHRKSRPGCSRTTRLCRSKGLGFIRLGTDEALAHATLRDPMLRLPSLIESCWSSSQAVALPVHRRTRGTATVSQSAWCRVAGPSRLHRARQLDEPMAEYPFSDDGQQLKPIDRIVLYIDDLDRCDPDQVVNVLQAVHLLLAMPLFVVVVGVDPRWLLRALRTRYQGILGEGAVDESDESLGFAESTPQNYLEKIFQVPFVLPEMDSTGFDQLIRSMAGQSNGALARSRAPAAEVPSQPAGDAVGSRPLQVAPAIEPEERSEVADAMHATDQTRPETVAEISAAPLTRGELKLLSLLAPLVRTPRAATRLFNVYGLLRSARNLGPGSQFLGGGKQPGDYQAVAQLLGILTGAPQLLGPLLWGRPADGEPATLGLCHSEGPGSWASFVDSLEPIEIKRKSEDRPVPKADGHSGTAETVSWSNAVAAQIDAGEVEAWQRLVSQLQQIQRHIELDDLSRYRMWGPQVARFSFLLSSFATTE